MTKSSTHCLQRHCSLKTHLIALSPRLGTGMDQLTSHVCARHLFKPFGALCLELLVQRGGLIRNGKRLVQDRIVVPVGAEGLHC